MFKWIVICTIFCLITTGILHRSSIWRSKEKEFKNYFDITFNLLIFFSGAFTVLKVWELPDLGILDK